VCPLVAHVILNMLALPGNEDVLSINPVVGETNDGYLSDIRSRHITPGHVFAAVKNANGGPVLPAVCQGRRAGLVSLGGVGLGFLVYMRT
jgi:D-aminopeptidase